MVLGLVSNNTFTGTVGDPAGSDATLQGTIVGEKFDGTAVNNDGDHFILSGKRVL